MGFAHELFGKVRKVCNCKAVSANRAVGVYIGLVSESDTRDIK